MNAAWSKGEEASRAAAADWLVRLQSSDVDEAAAMEFDAWLAADPANAAAYDAALSVMLELEAAAPRIEQALRTVRPGRSAASRRGWLAVGGLAAAATVAIALTPFSLIAPASQTYATAKGQHRSVTLADGSVIDLNAGSKITVSLGARERRVAMAEGEAVFDVAADKSRPFLIAAGDRTVRVVGTRFDVRRRAGQLSVTVERGLVEVRPSEGVQGRAWRLHPGQKLDHVDGSAAVQVSAVDPAQVLGWKSGRLIYRDQPLSEVVADLNQQFPRQIVLEDPALAQTKVSGVLVLDDQDAVIRRLALLAPIKALPSADSIVLRSDPAAKP